MKKSIFLFASFFFFSFLNAQITSVSYSLAYDSTENDTLFYIANLHINDGSTRENVTSDRVQFNSQLSIVTPSTVMVEAKENYRPLRDNANYEGAEPIEWQKGNVINTNTPTSDSIYVSFTPYIDLQTYHYNDLTEGDIVPLFKFAVFGDEICPLDVRLYINEFDYDSAELPDGSDFSNGFAIGSSTQLYSTNLYEEDYQDYIDIQFADKIATCDGNPAILSPIINCAPQGLTYLWSTGETTPSITVEVDEVEDFSVIISGVEGYSETFSTRVSNLDYVFQELDGSSFCLGMQIDLDIPHSTWEVPHPNIIELTGPSSLLCMGLGTTTITYIEPVSMCLQSAEITVTVPWIYVEGPDEICIGSTTTLSSFDDAGSWTSSDSNIATVTNTGVVTGVGAGQVTFIFTSSADLCQSSPSLPVTVYPTPVITVDQDTICVGQSTFATSNSFGGTWITDNPAIGTIDVFTGEITGVSEGIVFFRFVDAFNNCESESIKVRILKEALVGYYGSDKICVGSTTQLYPTTGGIWNSDDVAVAVVDNSGLVTGIDFGTSRFTFQDTVNNCSQATTTPVTVGDTQGLGIAGSENVCLGTKVLLSPKMGGIWTSIDPDTAAVTSDGLVTAQIVGNARFSYTADDPNCIVIDENVELTIKELPTIELIGPSELCGGDVSQFDFTGILNYVEYGGSTYTNNGIVTGLEIGTTEYYSIDGFGCSSDTIPITVIDAIYGEFNAPDIICPNQTTSVSPMVGVIWSSSDPTIATIDNNGLVTGVSPGIAFLDAYSPISGCSSHNSLKITVTDGPVVELLATIICIGDATSAQSTSNTEGTWQSSNSSVATITNEGIITGVDSGAATFSFIPSDGSCHGFSEILTVLPTPIFIPDFSNVCLGSPITGSLLHTTEVILEGPDGSYLDIYNPTSTNGEIVINTIGFVPGAYTLIPLDIENVGCEVYPVSVTLYPRPLLEPAELPEIFIGDTLELWSPELIVELFSSDTDIVFPINSLAVIGESVGEAHLVAMDQFGCFSDSILVTVIEDNIPCEGLDLTVGAYITGTAFIDANANETFDTDEEPLRNVVISVDSGNDFFLTDENGKYGIPTGVGSFTLNAMVNTGFWEDDFLTIANINITEPCNEGYNFGFIPVDVPAEVINLSMVNTIARCDWETRFTITAENAGTAPFEGTLVFEFDDNTTLFSSDLSSPNVSGNTISNTTGVLASFDPQQYIVTLKMPSGSANLPSLDFKATILNSSDEVVAEYAYSEQLRCSYDPNDKRAFPDREGDDNLTLFDEDLEYTIRFQNNGNDTAFQVKIVDPLDPSIEPSSIRVVSASHAVETCIEGTDLVFLFEDILLVDSMTNYPGSQGYVTFKCNVKDGVTEFTPVENQADIIFDTNEAIVTNQTLNTLVSVFCTDKMTTIAAAICEGEDYNGLTASGTYTETFDLPYGCDSVVTIELAVQGISYTQQNLQACAGDEVTIAGNVYVITENTTIIDTSYNDVGCISNIVTLAIEAVVDILGDMSEISLCLGESISIMGPIDGSWVSNDESIITIDENGNISTVGSGSTTLTFTDAILGCEDDLSVTVSALPEVVNTGSDELCITETTALTSTTASGTWSSVDANIATVTIDGEVTALANGSATMIFTDDLTGCVNTILIEVLPASDPECTVSTDDLAEGVVDIYPNPVTEMLFIDTEKEWSAVKLVNTNGQVVHTLNAVKIGITTMDIQSYTAGVYMLIFEDAENRWGKRVVIK